MSPSSLPASPLSVLIVGAGYSGIATAIQIRRQLGTQVKVQVIEKADGPGGIWKTSTWPGAGVDIPIHFYSLFSDLRSDWRRVYATQGEMLEYLEELIREHKLEDSFTYETEYESSTWDALAQTHTVTVRPRTGAPYTITANILISANGPLSKPLIPKLPGLDKFKGVYFHNLRWRADLDYSHKKIAVVGNGSSGIQLLPGLAEMPGTEVVQYIRSGGYFFPKVNDPIPEWTKLVLRWVPGTKWAHRFNLFLQSNARWTARNDAENTDHDAMESKLLAYLAKETPAEYLAALTPNYPLGCKRPAFDCGWLRSLHRPNVTLNSSGIAELTEDSIIAKDGSVFKPDIIVFATGSDVARHGVGLNVGLHGEGGKELQKHWEEIGGAQSFLGLAVPGFPNYFITLGPNAIAGTWGWTLGNSAHVIARLIKEMVAYDIGALQPRQEAFEKDNKEQQERLAHSTLNSNLCTSWWKVAGVGRVTVPNSLNSIQHWRATRRTNWSHWLAVERADTTSNSEKPREINVDAIIRRTIALQAVGAGVVLGLGWYFKAERAWGKLSW